MKRVDGREADQLRRIWFNKNFIKHPLSSILIEMGGTKVLCAVSVENSVPPWMRAQGVPGGWITSEYSMLPASTHQRSNREAARGKQSGRTMEIQRLIGRSLRAVVDLEALGQNTFYIDCDVIDADGGTRCASITGAAVALRHAFNVLLARKRLKKDPMRELVGAVSVGMLKGEPILDLCYDEDSTAEVDMNVIMTESGKFVEIQGCAEETPFSYEEMEKMLGLAKSGLGTIFNLQKKVLYGNKNNNNANGKSKPSPKNGGSMGTLGELMEGLDLEKTEE